MKARTRNGGLWLVLCLLALWGCGGDGDPPGTEPNPAVAPFVGTWDATTFTVTNDADPSVVVDFLDNGSFNINIQPSGLYTATLVLGALSPFVEIGQLTVTGNVLTLRPTIPNPCAGASEYEFSGPSMVTLEGPTCFDFNLDGIDEDAVALIVLVRR